MSEKVNTQEYPTDIAGECVVARVFMARIFIAGGLIDEAKFCLEQVTNVFPEPREQFMEAAFVSARKQAKAMREGTLDETGYGIELHQGGKV